MAVAVFYNEISPALNSYLIKPVIFFLPQQVKFLYCLVHEDIEFGKLAFAIDCKLI